MSDHGGLDQAGIQGEAMRAKYLGRCRYCGKPIEAGRDEYEIDTKTSYHIECHENQTPGPEEYERAHAIGFIAVDIDLPADGLLRRMSRPNSGVATGRAEPATPGRQPALPEEVA